MSVNQSAVHSLPQLPSHAPHGRQWSTSATLEGFVFYPEIASDTSAVGRSGDTEDYGPQYRVLSDRQCKLVSTLLVLRFFVIRPAYVYFPY